MGLPLSRVFACLFLESGLFRFIISKNSRYFQYIDDISFVSPMTSFMKNPLIRNNCFYSHLNTKIKNGIIFYLKAFRIFTPLQLLNDVFDYIENSFSIPNLLYNCAKIKAFKIHKWKVFRIFPVTIYYINVLFYPSIQ